jgi:hypothetical protein
MILLLLCHHAAMWYILGEVQSKLKRVYDVKVTVRPGVEPVRATADA